MIKISELTPKGATLADTDLLEISEETFKNINDFLTALYAQ